MLSDLICNLMGTAQNAARTSYVRDPTNMQPSNVLKKKNINQPEKEHDGTNLPKPIYKQASVMR